mgnify:CR=1 FL=1
MIKEKAPNMFSDLSEFKTYYLNNKDEIIKVLSCKAVRGLSLETEPYHPTNTLNKVRAFYQPESHTLFLIEYKEGK